MQAYHVFATLPCIVLISQIMSTPQSHAIWTCPQAVLQFYECRLFINKICQLQSCITYQWSVNNLMPTEEKTAQKIVFKCNQSCQNRTAYEITWHIASVAPSYWCRHWCAKIIRTTMTCCTNESKIDLSIILRLALTMRKYVNQFSCPRLLTPGWQTAGHKCNRLATACNTWVRGLFSSWVALDLFICEVTFLSLLLEVAIFASEGANASSFQLLPTPEWDIFLEVTFTFLSFFL